jgi:NAD(P)-dependent dehydrogenase (short-subunit alcohol dehydrogenase family)|tara:strand:+ start:235 stop:987 length:753 start_codon:yes stop_codon:yes gene_type:complete
MQINGTTAIVTGAASGLGAATAGLLSECGAKVASLDLSFDTPNSIGDSALQHPCDVTDEASVQAALAAATEALGTARILVNCAGIAESRRVLGREGVMSLEHFRRIIDVHVVGTFNVTRLFADAARRLDPITADGHKGVVVNTSSVAGLEGLVGAVSYSTAKAGIAGMTLPLAREFGREGIRVMAIAPGFFETPMAATVKDDALDQFLSVVPFPKRLGEPREYAELVRHICENDMLNGSVIRLDAAIRVP